MGAECVRVGEPAAAGQVHRVRVRTGVQVLHRGEEVQEGGSHCERSRQHRQVASASGPGIGT